MTSRKASIDPFIFGLSALILFVLIGSTFLYLNSVQGFLDSLRIWIVASFTWLFVVAVTGFVLFALYLAFSKYGHIKLGKSDSKPAFSTLSWFAMLFSAGMGIGLVFYGVAEPILHFSSPPMADLGTMQAARDAMRLSVFHWGINAWGIYAVLGLALAFSHFRLGLPFAIRSTLKPILGEATDKLPGKLIDVLAVLATVFGLATSLGLGAAQINAGLNHLFEVSISTSSQLMIIGVITLCATLSLVTGLNSGIRRLSEANMILAFGLLLFVFFVGPTAHLLRGIPDHLSSYVQTVVEMSLYTDAFGKADWQGAWTVFYWAWWISWSPFVGMFIARISEGRTIKEFVLGVLLAPTLAGLLWFSVFGGAALHIELFGDGGIVEAVNSNVATAIFSLLESYPYASLSSLVAIFVIAIFFITSSDSGSFVVDMLTSGGDPTPPIWQRIFWAAVEGVVAGVLLVIGGLGALQAGAISTGLPFCLVLIAVCFALLKNLRETTKTY